MIVIVMIVTVFVSDAVEVDVRMSVLHVLGFFRLRHDGSRSVAFDLHACEHSGEGSEHARSFRAGIRRNPRRPHARRPFQFEYKRDINAGSHLQRPAERFWRKPPA